MSVTHLEFKVHTPNLLKEIIECNPSASILRQPINIFANLLQQVSLRAIELNDPRLNALMCRLTLYSVADPESKDYNPTKLRLVEALGMVHLKKGDQPKKYCFNGLSGCVVQKRNRRTRLLVGLYHAGQAGMETDPEAPWATVCEEHHTLVCHYTLTLAHDHLAVPWGWCEECAKLVEGKS